MLIKWKCLDCKNVYTSDTADHHTLDKCKCGNSYIDAETYCLRLLGNAEIINKEETDKYYSL